MKINWQMDPPGDLPILVDLEKRSRDLSDPLNSIKNLLLSSISQNFDDEGRPKAWEDLAESTKKRRRKQNKWPGPILSVSGQLASSVTAQVDGNSILVGSAKPYARIHDLGGEINHPGTSNGFGRGINIPAHTITIPQREYLLFQDEDLREAESILTDHLLGGLRFG